EGRLRNHIRVSLDEVCPARSDRSGEGRTRRRSLTGFAGAISPRLADEGSLLGASCRRPPVVQKPQGVDDTDFTGGIYLAETKVKNEVTRDWVSVTAIFRMPSSFGV